MAEPNPLYETGQFVWSYFPYENNPIKPGPDEHIVYVIGLNRHRDGTPFVICAYTTSQPWKTSEKPPIGVIPITKDVAKSLGQKPFMIDVRRIGFLPINSAFFPRLTSENKGALPHRASKLLQNLILNHLSAVAKRPEYVIQLGPFRPSGRGGMGE
jgi:hypothetical protein